MLVCIRSILWDLDVVSLYSYYLFSFKLCSEYGQHHAPVDAWQSLSYKDEKFTDIDTIFSSLEYRECHCSEKAQKK